MTTILGAVIGVLGTGLLLVLGFFLRRLINNNDEALQRFDKKLDRLQRNDMRIHDQLGILRTSSVRMVERLEALEDMHNPNDTSRYTHPPS